MSYILTNITDSYTPPFSFYNMDIDDLKELYIDRVEQYFMSDYVVCNYVSKTQYKKKKLAPADIGNLIFAYMLNFRRDNDSPTIPSFFIIFIWLTFYTNNWTEVDIEDLEAKILEFINKTDIFNTTDLLNDIKKNNLYNYSSELYSGLYYFINQIFPNMGEVPQSDSFNIIDYFLIFIQYGCGNDVDTNVTIPNSNIYMLTTDEEAIAKQQEMISALENNPNFILTYNDKQQVISAFNKSTQTYLFGGDSNGR